MVIAFCYSTRWLGGLVRAQRHPGQRVTLLIEVTVPFA